MKSNETTRVEREHTNQSLNKERQDTDEVLTVKLKRSQDLADEVVETSREKADEVLNAAREKADEEPKPNGTQASVAQDRESEDAILRDERASADDNLRREREEQSRILAALLPLERESTDRCLLTERGLADDAVVHRDDLMGIISHDLRNLLSGIAMNARILAKQASDSEEGRRTLLAVDRIERYVAYMNRLIGDYIDVASVDTGKFAVHPQPGDVAEVISEAIASFAPSAREKGLSLEIATDGQVLHAVFDRERMLQVVGNLIANAMKFTHSGEAITLQAEQAGDDLRVSVLDTGEGIAADMREAIFERFVQAGGDDHPGLGLGLYISKCIVEAQGGRIWVESNPAGTGSAFHFTIPAVAGRDHKQSFACSSGNRIG